MNSIANLARSCTFLLCASLAEGQTIERVSVATGGGQADGPSGTMGDGNLDPVSTTRPSLSGDGRFVAFTSAATNLVPSDTNGLPDVFVRDRLLGTTVCASTAPNGVPASGPSYHPALSADGRFVAFVSQANDLDPSDGYSGADVFIRDLVSGSTRIISVDPSGNPADGDSGFKWWHLGAPDSAHVTTLVAISDRGRFVAFASRANNLVIGDTSGWDIFVRDLQLGITTRESVATGGTQANNDSGMLVGSAGDVGTGLAISGDGRIVAFTSKATNLDPIASLPGVQLFVRNRIAGTTQVASVGLNGQLSQRGLYHPSLSADGRYLAFNTTTPNWVLGDAASSNNIFLRDLSLGTTVLVDVLPNGAPAFSSGSADLDDSGRRIVFDCTDGALLPPDTNAAEDVYFARNLGPLRRISGGIGGSEADAGSYMAAISGRGNAIAFVSFATNLVPADTNGVPDVFVRF